MSILLLHCFFNTINSREFLIEHKYIIFSREKKLKRKRTSIWNAVIYVSKTRGVHVASSRQKNQKNIKNARCTCGVIQAKSIKCVYVSRSLTLPRDSISLRTNVTFHGSENENLQI